MHRGQPVRAMRSKTIRSRSANRRKARMARSAWRRSASIRPRRATSSSRRSRICSTPNRCPIRPFPKVAANRSGGFQSATCAGGKNAGQPGTLIARDDSASGRPLPADSDLIRAFREYVGVVAESSVRRGRRDPWLRSRAADPAKSNFQPPLISPEESRIQRPRLCRRQHARVRQRATRGRPARIPQRRLRARPGTAYIRRRANNEGGEDLQIGFANNDKPKGDHAFSVGLVNVDATTGDGFGDMAKYLVVRDTGNIGAGTTLPTQLLTLGGDKKTRLEIGRVSTASFPWCTNTPQNDGAFAINQQSKGSDNAGADFALKRDGKLRVMLGDGNTYLSAQNGDVAFLNNEGEPGETEIMRANAAGNLGIGSSGPAARLDVNGDIAIEQMSSGGPRPLRPPVWHACLERRQMAAPQPEPRLRQAYLRRAHTRTFRAGLASTSAASAASAIRASGNSLDRRVRATPAGPEKLNLQWFRNDQRYHGDQRCDDDQRRDRDHGHRRDQRASRRSRLTPR